MRIVWLPRALRELSAIRTYIAADNPSAAAEIARKIIESTALLLANPRMGRRGLLHDTREWIIYPYILIYRIRNDRIEILRVVHGAPRRP